MIKVCISMPKEMVEEVDKIAKTGLTNGVGRSEIIRRAIEEWLKRNKLNND